MTCHEKDPTQMLLLSSLITPAFIVYFRKKQLLIMNAYYEHTSAVTRTKGLANFITVSKKQTKEQSKRKIFCEVP